MSWPPGEAASRQTRLPGGGRPPAGQKPGCDRPPRGRVPVPPGSAAGPQGADVHGLAPRENLLDGRKPAAGNELGRGLPTVCGSRWAAPETRGPREARLLASRGPAGNRAEGRPRSLLVAVVLLVFLVLLVLFLLRFGGCLLAGRLPRLA